MHDQLCDVISYFVCSCGVGKICVHDKILIENPLKREWMEIRLFSHEFSAKRMYGLEFIAC